MNEETKKATREADELLQHILTTQPNLIAPNTRNSESGKNVADFIATLRNGLISMYQSVPR